MKENEPRTFLFVGLGNPGAAYENTRHNLGLMVCESFAKRMGWSFREDRRFNARVTKGVESNHTVHLVLPLTFMNLSGMAVKPYVDYYKIGLNEVVVVADDISLPFGQLRLRSMGSAGGHNGLKSIEHHLGSTHYTRLRMGVGHPGEQVLADYVLEPFNQMERNELAKFVDRGVEVLQRLLRESLSHVMNGVNTVLNQLQKDGSEPKDLTKPPVTGRGE